MTKTVNILACIIILMCISCSSEAQRRTIEHPKVSVRGFVQSFYDWYVPLALKMHNPKPSGVIALDEKPYLFSPELAKALRYDYDAQAKVPGIIVGIDWDPFLWANDPCESYVVGDAKEKGDRWFVDVFSVCSGKKSAHPDFVAVLKRKGSSWIFVNFYDPDDNQDLLTILKRLRLQRQEDSRS